MDTTALAQLFYQELKKNQENTALSPLAQTDAHYRLLNKLFVEVTRSERLRFSTLFSRIAYAAQRAELSRKLQYYINHFRRAASDLVLAEALPEDKAYLPDFGGMVLAHSIAGILKEPIPANVLAILPHDWPLSFQPVDVEAFRAQVRVVALDDDSAAKQLLIKDEEQPENVQRMAYELPDRNDNFTPTVKLIRQIFGFPLVLNLLDVEIGSDGVYRPRAIVVEPDYLVDVSAIAESFQPSGAIPDLFILKKFLPFDTSVPLMLGNIANFFLDELMHNPKAEFRATFTKVFRLNPLALCTFSDREMLEIMQKAQKHFVNLKKVIIQDFQEEGIEAGNAYLEPTFYSQYYGLQGRLDVLAQKTGKSVIVELKSGKAFQPNMYGLSNNHFTQTLLYDLIIRSSFGKKSDPRNYILYSRMDERQLRYAPVIKAQQFEALQVRNQMLALERILMEIGDNAYLGSGKLEEQGDRLFSRLSAERIPSAKGFLQRDLDKFSKVYSSMSSLEKRYFLAFSGFIAREHKLAKTGQEGSEHNRGQARLWLNDYASKQEDFELLAQLQLVDNKAQEEEPILRFVKTEETNPLANFRKGDIAVLYPFRGKEKGPLQNQLFKCTVIDLNAQEVTVRLRSRQFNDKLFRDFELWNLEHDLLDSSFVGMYRSLYAFMQCPQKKRQLLLGTQGPELGEELEIPAPAGMTVEQQDIFQRLLRSKDYFLLWGPPGTGKTSIMLRALIGYLYDQTDENILVLAYTNRAVDEICHAIESYRPDMHHAYLRIGSRYSTGTEFQDRLLSFQTAKVDNRGALKALIKSHRIIIATVASVSTKPELFQLKKFQRVIIDEASQILEPMLVGLLPNFEHFTLIGDHKQLPAVVAQDTELSAVDDPLLNEIGLQNLRNSFFERLFIRCKQAGWEHAYAQLSHQGRMHRDIMLFPNRYFYDGGLKILPKEVTAHLRQLAPGQLLVTENEQERSLTYAISSNRVVFLPTPPDTNSRNQKTNVHEAAKVVEVIRTFRDLFAEAGKVFNNDSIGIITPYRAQIAQIRQMLETEGWSPDDFTVDTVERYQGGARDIILISLCANSIGQVSQISSLSDEGVDRKLNVALTRAREHLVIIGCPQLLQYSQVYRDLMEHCGIR